MKNNNLLKLRDITAQVCNTLEGEDKVACFKAHFPEEDVPNWDEVPHNLDIDYPEYVPEDDLEEIKKELEENKEYGIHLIIYVLKVNFAYQMLHKYNLTDEDEGLEEVFSQIHSLPFVKIEEMISKLKK